MYALQMKVLFISAIFVANIIGALSAFVVRHTQGEGQKAAAFIGFASGMMLSSAVFSLIVPTFYKTDKTFSDVVQFVVGMCAGGVFIFLSDIILNKKKSRVKSVGVKKLKFFIAVTIHNLPEGFAVGALFGNADVSGAADDYAAAAMFAVGVAIQNIPESAAVTIQLTNIMSRKKAFLFGIISGAAELAAAVVGAVSAGGLSTVNGWFMYFAAGTVLFVVFEDMTANSGGDDESLSKGGFGALFGFVTMTCLEMLC